MLAIKGHRLAIFGRGARFNIRFGPDTSLPDLHSQCSLHIDSGGDETKICAVYVLHRRADLGQKLCIVGAAADDAVERNVRSLLALQSAPR